MAETTIIQHVPDGERYAITIGDSGITAACGPLYFRDIPAALNGDFNDDPETREWIENAPDGEFVDAYIDLETVEASRRLADDANT